MFLDKPYFIDNINIFQYLHLRPQGYYKYIFIKSTLHKKTHIIPALLNAADHFGFWGQTV